MRALASPEQVIDAYKAHAKLDRNLNDPYVEFLAERGLGPMAGAAQGLNPAVFMNNVPAPGSYVIDQATFDAKTERNDVPQPTDTWPGYGGRIDHRISNVGVLSNVRLTINLSVVVSGGGTVTAKYPWPLGLLNKVTLNANGGSAIISCNGLDLDARRQRLFRNPREGLETSPGMDTTATITAAAPYKPTGAVFPGVIANGTYPVTLIVDLPIVHDPRTLTGALFAQSDQNYLNWVIETAQAADIFTLAGGSTAVITGTVDSTLTFYSIPSMDTSNGRVVVLPAAVQYLHQFVAQDKYFTNQGDVLTPFIKNNGQLACAYVYIDNGGTSQIAPTALSAIQWTYAGNQTPRNYSPPAVLLEENQRLYNGLITPGYFLLDFEAENVRRDAVFPRGLSELAINTRIPTSVTVNPNAHVHVALETLVQG